MEGVLIGGVGLVYFGTAISFLCKGNYMMGIVYAGYSLSNVGLYMLAVKGT